MLRYCTNIHVSWIQLLAVCRVRRKFASLPARAMFCLADFEAHAEKTLCKSSLNYFSCGADDEDTLRWNAEGFYRSDHAYIWVPPIALFIWAHLIRSP